jgi:hypothetical protein
MIDRRQMIRCRWQPRHRGALLVAIKTMHTLLWFSIESCMVYLLYAGFAWHSDRRALLAATVVGGESLVFAANGFRCPLTRLADSLGAGSGSVTDIYLPDWLAHALPAIHAPLLLLAASLHGRNLWQQRKQKWDTFLLGHSCSLRDDSPCGEEQAQPTTLHDASRHCRPT